MAWEDRGKIIKGARNIEQCLHRFSLEKKVTQQYDNFLLVNREFYDRKSGRQVALITNKDNILYINKDAKNSSKCTAAINEAKRLSKATEVSEYMLVSI